MEEVKRHSIGMNITQSEMTAMSMQIKALKLKTGWSRNQVLKVVCLKLLTDDEFIDYVQRKGNLKKKQIRCRKRK